MEQLPYNIPEADEADENGPRASNEEQNDDQNHQPNSQHQEDNYDQEKDELDGGAGIFGAAADMTNGSSNGGLLLTNQNMSSGGIKFAPMFQQPSETSSTIQLEMIDQLPSDYIYAEMFKAFDVTQQGFIDRIDMECAAKALGWRENQLHQLIEELDPSHSGQITFEEFVLIMKYIEQKQQQLPNNSASQQMIQKSESKDAQKDELFEPSQQLQQNSQQNSFLSNEQSAHKEDSRQDLNIYELDKKRFGALLPKTGVYFLPDERIIAFLKIMNEIRKRYESVGNYMMANKFKGVFERWSQDEQQRQLHNMRVAQQRELVNIESAQRVQYQEFAEAWDKYMADYELTAYNLVENHKIKQVQELEDMRRVVTEKFYNEHRWNKQIIELRKQERIYFAVKDYVNAEKVKLICQALEKKQVEEMQGELEIKIAKEEATLRQKLNNQMQTLLRRIQRDREEQVKHRQVDSNRLIQRNKNLLKDILEKQATEKRRTENFLKFALRKREDKTDEEIKQQMRNNSYDPKSDPLMPRLFRKFDNTKSKIIMDKLNQGSIFQEKFSNNKSYKAGEGYGSQRTYLCINPLRSMSKNRELFHKVRGLSTEETERAMLKLDQIQSNLPQIQNNYRTDSLNENSLQQNKSPLELPKIK